MKALWTLARTHRRASTQAFYAVATAGALVLAYGLRFELEVPDPYLEALPWHAAGLLGIRYVVARALRLPDGQWRYVAVDDMLRLGLTAGLSSATFFLAFRVMPALPPVPLSVVLIEAAVFTLGVSSVWAVYRRTHEVRQARGARGPDGPPPRRIVLVGSGEAGNMLARELNRSALNARVVAFLDDDPVKRGTLVQGVEVIGSTAEAESLLPALLPDEIAMAIPSATPRQLRRIVERLEPLGLPLKVLPGIRGVVDGEIQPGALRPLEIDDLLGREPVTLELPELQADLEGATVLVTGAAGSIGSELARQIAVNGPRRLILLDQAESDLYWIDLELRKAHPDLKVEAVVADILDLARVRDVFDTWKPDRVYHAAAYKHVPLMEMNPREAIRNNVLGTWHVAEAAGEGGTGRFVLISTDKAADPVSVMGASKRAAELAVQHLAEAHPETHFTAVRFGNVLGSNGSVIPLFQKQIAEGGPITITHPEVTRYFMTIPEAVQLVLQAALLPEARGEIAMLEMGDPVRIVDLARNLVRLQGKRPEVDIPFTYTGLRPGEKMHEELVGEGEETSPTSLDQVRIVRVPPGGGTAELQQLLAVARNGAMEEGWGIHLVQHLVGAGASEPTGRR